MSRVLAFLTRSRGMPFQPDRGTGVPETVRGCSDGV
jgi:hypothetical protein